MSGPEHLVAGARLLLRHAEQRLADEGDQCGGVTAFGDQHAVKRALHELEPIPEPDQPARDSEADALSGLFAAFPELLGDE